MPPSPQLLQTPLTQMFGINHPVMLAGMNVAAGPKLAAAVSNAGGIGTIGGASLTPKMLRHAIAELKEYLEPEVRERGLWGVDLLIPKVGGTARKTNRDYTQGQMPTLLDIIVQEKARLFVCAIGVPEKWMVERLHAGGVLVMNMIGHPKHVQKALDVGVDIICAQGGEGGGHTGDTPFSILIPAVVDIVRASGAVSPLTKQPVAVVAAGGIADGRGLAASLAYGAGGVWVGTRFVASEEAGAPKKHKEMVLKAGWDDVVRTTIYSGRPMSVMRTPYIVDWETTRAKEKEELLAKGKVPYEADLEVNPERSVQAMTWLMGKVAGSVTEIRPAREIVDELVQTAARSIESANGVVVGSSARAKL